MINGSPEIIAIVMAFVGDISISRRCAGVPKIYPFLVIDPDIRDGYAAVREEQLRAWANKAELLAWANKAEQDHADVNNGTCETCGLCKLNLHEAYVNIIYLRLHRERAYLPNTDSVDEFIGRKATQSWERRHICEVCYLFLEIFSSDGSMKPAVWRSCRRLTWELGFPTTP